MSQGYLLDTHAFLFMVSSPQRLGAKTRRLLRSAADLFFLSAASVWEMAIKHSLGKLDLSVSLKELVERSLVESDLRLLGLELSHLYRVDKLPFHHRDPFDRLLAAQALEENLTVISRDVVFNRYEVRRMW